jgi:hypothetical protein
MLHTLKSNEELPLLHTSTSFGSVHSIKLFFDLEKSDFRADQSKTRLDSIKDE